MTKPFHAAETLTANKEIAGYFALCRLSPSEAEKLLMAPAMAGGWVAEHPDCRDAVYQTVGWTETAATFLALLPRSWPEASKRPVTREQAERILAQLDARAKLSLVDEEEVPFEFATRLRAHLQAERS
jgi:hypothetical protein